MRLVDQGSKLAVSLNLIEKILSLHGDFVIPKEKISKITQTLPGGTWRDLRLPGTFFPGIIKAGTYFTPRGREFWFVTRSNKHKLTIELTKHFYKRLVFTTSQPYRQLLPKT